MDFSCAHLNKRNLSVVELAKLTGISRGTAYKYMKMLDEDKFAQFLVARWGEEF